MTIVSGLEKADNPKYKTTTTNRVSPSEWKFQNNSAQTQKKQDAWTHSDRNLDLTTIELEINVSSRNQDEKETQQLVLSIDTETVPKRTTVQGIMSDDGDTPLSRGSSTGHWDKDSSQQNPDETKTSNR